MKVDAPKPLPEARPLPSDATLRVKVSDALVPIRPEAVTPSPGPTPPE